MISRNPAVPTPTSQERDTHHFHGEVESGDRDRNVWEGVGRLVAIEK